MLFCIYNLQLRQMDINWLRQIKRHPEEEQALVMGHIPMMLKLNALLLFF